MADLIPASAMAKLREIDQRAMPSTCRVLRRELGTSSGGRSAPSAEVEVAEVACRLEPSGLRPEEAEALGRLAEETHGTLSLPLGTDVQSEDRIEVTTGADVDTFEVVGDPWPGSYSTSLSVVVQREG